MTTPRCFPSHCRGKAADIAKSYAVDRYQHDRSVGLARLAALRTISGPSAADFLPWSLLRRNSPRGPQATLIGMLLLSVGSAFQFSRKIQQNLS
jgi:hypothetical protein